MKPQPPKINGQDVQDTEWNSPVQENIHAVATSGQTPVEADSYQLSKAMAQYTSAGDYYQDTGTANAYVVNAIAPRSGIPLYATGQMIRFVAANTNTGASTINVQALGAVSLLNQEGAALTGGEIQAGDEIKVEYEGTAMRLVNGTAGLAALMHTIDGLTISNNLVAPTTDIDFAVGKCGNSDRDFIIRNTTPGFTKDVTTNWAAGDGNGGKPTAVTITTSTWYYVFVISKLDGTFDAGIDTNLVATNLLADSSPAGYVKWRRIGSIYALPSTPNIRLFTQYGDWFYYYQPISTTITDFTQTGVNPALNPYIWTVLCPPSVTTKILINYLLQAAGSSPYNLYLYNSNQLELQVASPIGGSPLGFDAAQTEDVRGRMEYIPDSSSQVLITTDALNPSAVVKMNCLGYEDRRLD